MAIILFAGAVSLLVEGAIASPKRVYIAPDDHTDYLWAANEETYRRAFLDMIDYYLDQADATETNPSDYQGRWNCDGSFWMWTYEKNKTSAEFERLIGRVQDGHFSVPLNALCVSLGGAPAEAVLRGMYYPGTIERRYNLRFPLVYTMENATQPYGLTALWAGSGAKYSWKGICGCDTRLATAGDRDYEIYWATGPDGSRVLTKWNSIDWSFHWGNDGMGGYAEARYPSEIVDYVTVNAGANGFLDRYPYDAIGCFGKGWDDVQTMTDEFISVAQATTDATRRVIVSNEVDFFEDFEAAYGADLPSVAASFGNEWDLYCAALAEDSARVKRAVEKLRTAEAMATLVSLEDQTFMDGRDDLRSMAWMGMGLYWEHNFGMYNPPTGNSGKQERIAWQRRLATDMENYIGALYADAAAALAGMIGKSGDGLRFYAFNPLSWARTDMADFPYGGAEPVHVVDLTTGLETPSQIVTVDGERRIRVHAVDVPPLGYKVFEVRNGAGTGFAAAASASGNIMENDSYRVTLSDRGAITSLIDKERGDASSPGTWEVVTSTTSAPARERWSWRTRDRFPSHSSRRQADR